MLEEWAKKWSIPEVALIALRQHLLLSESRLNSNIAISGMGEAGIQAHVRHKASEAGWRLWRNNVGAATLRDGSFVRWGLCNDSKQVNSQIKSGDLIGIKPVIITEAMIGTTIGQFVSRECKTPGWTYNASDERSKAQMRWAEIVTALGGDAKITTGGL